MTIETTMNGEGRKQQGGYVPPNNYGDGRNDKEAWVASLGIASKDSFVKISEGLGKRDYSALEAIAFLEGRERSDWIGSCRTCVEVAE